MKTHLTSFIFFFSCLFYLHAQQGGFSSAIWNLHTHMASSIEIDNDSNYVLGGANYTSGYNSFVIKLDSNGAVLWKKVYEENNQNIYISKIVCLDTGYIILYNKGLIKTDKNGNVVWANAINTNAIYLTDMTKTHDNGIIAVGHNNNYLKSYVIKFDYLGNTQWSKQIFCNGEMKGPFFVKQLPDSSFMIGTERNNQFFLVRLNSSGQVFQSKKIDQAFSYIFGSNMIFDGDNFYFVLCAGKGQSNYIFYLNTDSLFSSKYCVRFYSFYNNPFPFYKHPDGDLIILNTPDVPLQHFQLVKIDSIGTFKSSYNPWFLSRDFKVLNDGRLLIAGDAWEYGTGFQVGLYRTDFNGENPCIKTENMPVYTDTLTFVNTTCTTDTFISSAFTHITLSSPTFNFAPTCLHVSLDEKADIQTRPQVFPNPGNGLFEIAGLPDFFRPEDYTLTLYSSLGQEVPCKSRTDNKRLFFEAYNQPPGLYMLLLSNNKEKTKPQSLKFIISE